jgi:hypothetical protein
MAAHPTLATRPVVIPPPRRRTRVGTSAAGEWHRDTERGNQMVIHGALSSQRANSQRVSRDGELPTPCPCRSCRSRSAHVYPCSGRHQPFTS